MNTLDKQYQDLLATILEHGVTKKDRTGTGTKSIFGYTIRHNMKHGFPLLTTKKMAWKSVVTELLWFLCGDTNIKFLVDNGCHIWNGDAYKRYWHEWKPTLEDCGLDLTPYTQEEFINKIKTDDEFAKKWGELGPIYGKQWRSWEVLHYDKSLNHTDSDIECYRTHIDQIANLISELKTNPDSRRLMVNAWNVGELDQMVLPPCHYGFQVYTRELSRKEKIEYLFTHCYETGMERQIVESSWTDETFHDGYFNVPKRAISLMWNQRSVDTFLGLPFNIASYGLLLEIIAKAVNMVPDELIGNLGDTHLYSNHLEQAEEQVGRPMTWEEKIQWVMKNTDVELENLAITEEASSSRTPNRTREPFPLPTLLHLKTDEFYSSLSNDVSLFSHLDPCDFVLENYKSHPAINAPLSN